MLTTDKTYIVKKTEFQGNVTELVIGTLNVGDRTSWDMLDSMVRRVFQVTFISWNIYFNIFTSITIIIIRFGDTVAMSNFTKRNNNSKLSTLSA